MTRASRRGVWSRSIRLKPTLAGEIGAVGQLRALKAVAMQWVIQRSGIV